MGVFIFEDDTGEGKTQTFREQRLWKRSKASSKGEVVFKKGQEDERHHHGTPKILHTVV